MPCFPGAINLPAKPFDERAARLSYAVARKASALGYTNVMLVEGSYPVWRSIKNTRFFRSTVKTGFFWTVQPASQRLSNAPPANRCTNRQRLSRKGRRPVCRRRASVVSQPRVTMAPVSSNPAA